MDFNQAIRDFFGSTATEDKRAKYNEALVTGVLRTLVRKGLLSREEALDVVTMARKKVK